VESCSVPRGSPHGSPEAQRRHAGDGVQRPLRSRFQQQLKPGVDMIDATVVPKGLINLTFGTTVASIIIIF